MKLLRALILAPIIPMLAACGGPNSNATAHPAVTASADPPGTRVFKVDTALSTVSDTVTEHVPTISSFHPSIGTFRVTGKAHIKSGSIHVASEAAASTVRAIQVDPLELKTDIPFRDTNVDPTLTSAAGPAEFDSTRISGLPGTIPSGAPVRFQMSGQMQIHGVVKPLDFEVTATMTGDRLEADATTLFDMTTFGVDPPSGIASNVDPQVTLVIHLVARP